MSLAETRRGGLGDVWLVVSIALTLVAAVILATAVLPVQQRAVDLLEPRGDRAAERATAWAAGAPRLALSSGVFALLWVAVVVLMVVRPGSTTGV